MLHSICGSSLRTLVLAAFCGPLAPATPGQALSFDRLHQMLPVDCEYTNAVLMGDVDGDGDLDLVIGNGSGQNCLYLDDGSGVFSDATSTHMPTDESDGTTALAMGDVDGDGDPDLVIGNIVDSSHTGWGGQTRLYLNDGAGVFADATAAHMPAILSLTRALALADVDGDGDLDLVVVGDNDVLLHLNDGSGVFTDVTSTHMPIGVANPFALALDDVDGDGDPDLVLGNRGWWLVVDYVPEQNSLWLNDGAGHFSDVTATHMPVHLDFTHALELGDVDGDGDRDLIVGTVPNASTGGQNLLYLNDGAGHFNDATATHLPVDSEVTFALALDDLDGDGDHDLVVGNYEQQSRLYLNDGTGVFSDATSAHLPADSDATYALEVGDVDGDGDPDLVIGNVGSGQNRLYLNDAAGSFSDATARSLPADRDFTEALALGDVDGDGDRDLVVGNAWSGNRLYLNDGTGFFTDVTPTHLPSDTDRSLALALGDVDGDGDLDLAIGNRDQQNRLYLNDGTGRFSDATATHMPADAEWTTSLALGDVDGDGDRDLVVGNGGVPGQQNRLYLNDGTGHFSDATATHLPADAEWTTSLALGDVDRDGDPDLVIGNSGPSGRPMSLYLNDGFGRFRDVTAMQLPANPSYTHALTLGDVDGDGDRDLVLAYGLYLNDGGGTFSDATATQLPAPPSDVTRKSLALGDTDGDGDLDFVLGTDPDGTGGQNRLYLNDGMGHFTDVTVTHLPVSSEYTHALAMGDVDGDGDLDLIVGNTYGCQNRLLTDLSRQLAWRAIPRIGKPLTMDLHGAPGNIWLLAWALDSAEIPLPPWGTLRLDPTTLQVAGMGSLDGDGFASMSWSTPNDPALVGVSFHLQAVIGAPLRLSNREEATFTNL